MDLTETSTEKALTTEVEEEISDVTNYASVAYNHTVTFVRREMEYMSDHQKIGVACIFLLSSVVLVGCLFLLFCGRKTCRRWFSQEEKYVVYRRMVEFGHIIALDPPKSEKQKLPI